MPTLARILIYPIKSMPPLEVDACRLLRGGALEHDRALALFDAAGKVVNGKRTAAVHAVSATLDPPLRRVDVLLSKTGRRASFHLDRDRAALEAWLGEAFGFPVFPKENPAGGWPDDTDSPGPTVISTATLREVAAWFAIPLAQARERFRTNLEIDGVEPFWEDRLYGPAGTLRRFRVGEVLFDGVNPCRRCAVPPRDPATGEPIPGFTAKFMALREKTLPPWAERSRFDHFYRLAVNTRFPDSQPAATVHIGDEIALV